MDKKRISIDAVKPMMRKTRLRDPKPWVLVGDKVSPHFEHIGGCDAAHIGYQLQPTADNPDKLTLSDKKLYFRFGTSDALCTFCVLSQAKLSTKKGIAGYGVFPIGFFSDDDEVGQSDGQTAYKRAWQMSYEEWKEGKPLTVDTVDHDTFWKTLNKWKAKFTEDGRGRKKATKKEPEELSSTPVAPSDESPWTEKTLRSMGSTPRKARLAPSPTETPSKSKQVRSPKMPSSMDKATMPPDEQGPAASEEQTALTQVRIRFLEEKEC